VARGEDDARMPGYTQVFTGHHRHEPDDATYAQGARSQHPEHCRYRLRVPDRIDQAWVLVRIAIGMLGDVLLLHMAVHRDLPLVLSAVGEAQMIEVRVGEHHRAHIPRGAADGADRGRHDRPGLRVSRVDDRERPLLLEEVAVHVGVLQQVHAGNDPTNQPRPAAAMIGALIPGSHLGHLALLQSLLRRGIPLDSERARPWLQSP
jgi:hypothetical protein